MVRSERREEVAEFLLAVRAWGEGRDEIAAAALVGSWARDDARETSDVDVILLGDDLRPYLESDEWARELGAVRVIRCRDWGAISERRLLLSSGLEVEVGFGRPSWASVSPVDPGTQRVVRDGLRILSDGDGLLARLTEACVDDVQNRSSDTGRLRKGKGLR